MYKHIITSALVAFISIAFVSSAQATDWRQWKTRAADSGVAAIGDTGTERWARWGHSSAGVNTETHAYANNHEAGYYAEARGWTKGVATGPHEAALASHIVLGVNGTADKGRGPGVASASNLQGLAIIVGTGSHVRVEQHLSGQVRTYGEDRGRHEYTGGSGAASISQYGSAFDEGRDARASVESVTSISVENTGM